MNTLKILLCIVVSLTVIVTSALSAHCRGETKKIPGTEGAAYLSDMENEVVREINRARGNPQAYAAYLEQMRNFYRGKRFERPGRTTILTREGVSALEEAIRYLRSAKKAPQLTPSRGMSLGAKDLMMEQKTTGSVGHTGRDGSSPGDRVNRYGRWGKTVGENIEYGGDTPRSVVINLIIDDGVPGRGHRNNLFDGEFQIVGIACGRHNVYRHMCVITFAGEYTDK